MLAAILYVGLNFSGLNVTNPPPYAVWASKELEPDTEVKGAWRTPEGIVTRTVIVRPGEFFAQAISQSHDRRYLTLQSAPRVPPAMAEHGDGYTSVDYRSGTSKPELFIYEWKSGSYSQIWRSNDIGDFSVEWEPNRHRILIYRRSNAYTDYALGPFYYGILNVKTMNRKQIPFDDPYVYALWSKTPGKIEIRKNVAPGTLLNVFDCKTWKFKKPVKLDPQG
jgi:hypothetical protein